MADRTSVTISIGGTLPCSHFPALLEAIALEHLWSDWDAGSFAESDFTPGAPLRLVGHDVRHGELDTLEAFCRETGLSYIRWAGGCVGAFSAERVVFTGSGEPRSYGVDEEDDLIMTLEAIRRLGSIEAIEAHFDGAEREPEPLFLADGPPDSD
jgi:hypothetical protein